MRDKFLVYGAPKIEDDDVQEVVNVMQSGWLGTGPKVHKFEKDFSQYKEVNHAIALNSCTASLHLSLLAAEIGVGDEVITTPLTFCATINAIIHSGATPVLVDVDPRSMNIDPLQIEAAITPKTKAILPVHFSGYPCDMDKICDIAEKNQLLIIEDCAHAIETEYKGKKAGTIGDFGCFSFYVTKNVITGEGGMIVTNKENWANKIKCLALHGMSKDAWKRFSDSGYKHYDIVECGYKYNMMDLQAAIGIHQLERVEKNWLRRREIWQRYEKELSHLPIKLPYNVTDMGSRHAYHLYTVLIDEFKTGISRDEFLDCMTRRNIGVGVHYRSIPEHTYYKNTYSWQPEDYPVASMIGKQTVSLPLSANLSDTDVSDVIEAINGVLSD